MTLLILQVWEPRLGETEATASGCTPSREEPGLASGSGLHSSALNPSDIAHILSASCILENVVPYCIQAGRKIVRDAHPNQPVKLAVCLLQATRRVT